MPAPQPPAAQPQPQPLDPLLTIDAVAQALGLSRVTVRDRINRLGWFSDDLVMLNRRDLRVPQSAVQRFIAALAEKSSAVRQDNTRRALDRRLRVRAAA